MLDELPRRERDVLECLFALHRATAEEIREQLADPPSNSAIRVMLGRLENKGLITRCRSGKRFIYSPRLRRSAASETSLRKIAATFFGGSPVSAATALLGMAGELKDHEIEEISKILDAAKGRNR